MQLKWWGDKRLVWIKKKEQTRVEKVSCVLLGRIRENVGNTMSAVEICVWCTVYVCDVCVCVFISAKATKIKDKKSNSLSFHVSAQANAPAITCVYHTSGVTQAFLWCVRVCVRAHVGGWSRGCEMDNFQFEQRTHSAWRGPHYLQCLTPPPPGSLLLRCRMLQNMKKHACSHTHMKAQCCRLVC